VDQIGLRWTVSDRQPPAPDPHDAEVVNEVTQRLQAGEAESLDGLDLSEAEHQSIQRWFAQRSDPWLVTPESFAAACQALEESSLLARVVDADGEVRWVTHRWTTGPLHALAGADPVQQAHRVAGGYWGWRIDTIPRPPEADLEERFEVRHHQHQAGDHDQAQHTSEAIASQLHTWGAWERESSLIHDTLTWTPPNSEQAAAWIHQLGIVAQERGDYDQALTWYRQSLTIKEELGNRAGMATTYQQLAVLAEVQGTPLDGLPQMVQALTIFLDLQSPNVSTCLAWLQRLHASIGTDAFRTALNHHLNAETTDAIIKAITDQAP
jgi:tetratricopeptide (TPR) repeat protein